MPEVAQISLKKMIDTHVALLAHADVRTDAREYGRGWPEAVRPIKAYWERFPYVVPVDRGIPLPAVADRASIALDCAPGQFADDPAVVETTDQFHRYVIYVHDGGGRFRQPRRGTEPPDGLPLTLLEGMFAVLHHGRDHGWRHGLVCAGSHDARGRHPVIASFSRGFLLTAVAPEQARFRFAVARRGTIIPSSL